MPIDAIYNPGTLTAIITFNQPLIAGPLLEGNWTIRIANEVFLARPGVAALGSVITFTRQMFGIALAGPDEVQYMATPPDVLALDGTPAAPFTTAWHL